MRPCEFGDGLLLQYKSNMCGTDWAASNCDTDVR